ncbi:MAG: phage tail protein I [Janthinobacterium lividum]
MTSTASLLPPNATPLERALEGATARVGAVDVSTAATLWDPATCPLALLPWLAWSLSVDQWDPTWPEATKRAAVADSIALHRIKGTRAAVEAVLARFDDLLSVIEWHEASPAATPHTFEVHLPLVTAPGVAPGGDRSTAAFADSIVREVGKAKPLREHLTLVQTLATQAPIGLAGAARLATWQRVPLAAVADTSPSWAIYLQTEDGEPMQAEDDSFLAHGA